MRVIKPGTKSWDAWLAYHRGTRNELVMLSCRRQGRAFEAWTEFPPEHARADRVTRRAEAPAKAMPTPHLDFRDHAIDGVFDALSRRTEARAERDADDADRRAALRKTSDKRERVRDRALTKVQIGDAPVLDKVAHLGTVAVFDPAEEAEVFAGKRAVDRLVKRAKVVNLRDDPIGQMAKREQISAAQLDAARRWQAWHDAAQIGSVRSFDPTAVNVDGGQLREVVSDVQRAALKRLVHADRQLGEVGAMIVRRILGDRMTIAQLGAILGDTSDLGLKRLGWRVRECLDTLTRATGVVVEGTPMPAPRDDAARMARYAGKPALHRAVHAARRPKQGAS
jgi:hypothetical protein